MHNTARLGSDRFIYLNTLLGALLVNSLFQLFMAFEELCSTPLEINWMNQSNLEINDMELELRSFCSTLLERNGINFWNVAWWTPSTWSILIKEMYGNDWLSVLQVGRRDTINSILYCLCSPKGAYGIDFIKRVDPATPIKNTTEHGNESIQFSLNGKNQLHGNQFMEKVLSFPIAWVMICSTKKSIRDKVDGMDRID